MGIAKLKSLAWNVLTLFSLGIIYWTIISEGLRLLMPVLGQKLHKASLPGFSYLDRFEATYRLDLAHGLAVFLFIATWNLWGMVLKSMLGSDEHFRRYGWNPQAFKRVVMVLGKVILCADAILFYIAMTQMGWSGTVFSIPALIATAGYVAILVFVKLVSVNLEKVATEDSSCISTARVRETTCPVERPSDWSSDTSAVRRDANSVGRSVSPPSRPR